MAEWVIEPKRGLVPGEHVDGDGVREGEEGAHEDLGDRQQGTGRREACLVA